MKTKLTIYGKRLDGKFGIVGVIFAIYTQAEIEKFIEYSSARNQTVKVENHDTHLCN